MKNTVTVSTLKKINSIEELKELGIGRLFYDISDRGGYITFIACDISSYFNISEYQLTPKIGAYVNYLGGGIRGGIGTSQTEKIQDKRKRRLIEELAQACKRAYIDAEEQTGLNDEYDQDGDYNWNAAATRAARNSGIQSAY